MARDYSEEAREPTDTADEDMLEKVRMGMGNESGPPPGSDMKWKDLAEDQAALEANPSDENIAAFSDYWGRENLPESVLGDVYAGSHDPTKAYSPEFQAGRATTMPMQEGDMPAQGAPEEGNPVQDTILRLMQGRVDRSR